MRFLMALVIGVAALVAARGLIRHNTWYLASDQFAFLTFAEDLQSGRVLHPLGLYALLAGRSLPAQPVDAFFQTYRWTGDRLFSSYPPGFPALLALVGMAGGPTAQHALNPLLFLVLLGVLAAAVYAAARRTSLPVAAGAAAAAPWLLLLLPSQIHLWGITLARDLPAHLLGLLAVIAALCGRHLVSGLFLGAASTVRPDVVLYGASLIAIARGDGWRARHGIASACGLVTGSMPLLLYNFWTMGHPLSFTQGNEFDRWLSQGARGGALLASLLVMPSGGGFRLTHFPDTFPGNLVILERAISFAAPWTLLGLFWSLRRGRQVARAFLPYAVVALPFFSFWSHPDSRYLVGIHLALVALTAVGAAVACRAMASPALRPSIRGAGAIVALAAVGAAFSQASTAAASFGDVAVAATTLGLAISVLAAGLGSLLPPRWRPRRWAPLAASVVLAAVGLVRMVHTRGNPEPYQRQQVERAKAAVEALVPPGALVLTNEGLGRPAENITHYTHARALYPSELVLLGVDPAEAVTRVMSAGHRVFLLVPTSPREPARAPWGAWHLDALARRKGEALYDWFVDPRAAPLGATLFEATPRESEP